MTTFNRVLVTLIWATGVALVLAALSRTGWAASLSPVGMAENYTNPIEPLIKVAAALTVMVAATKLIQAVARSLPKGREPMRWQAPS